MDCTENQKRQIEVLLGFALNEIQYRCGCNDVVGASRLAYSCHNLPGCHRNDHFELDYFRRWFHLFHEEHGKVLYNYLAMLTAIGDDREITSEIAFEALPELRSIKGEFIQWGDAPQQDGQNKPLDTKT
jgi:hypothetical protein